MAMENFIIHPSVISNIFKQKEAWRKTFIYSIVLRFWKVLKLPDIVNVIL
jgi:hypothetical protein